MAGSELNCDLRAKTRFFYSKHKNLFCVVVSINYWLYNHSSICQERLIAYVFRKQSHFLPGWSPSEIHSKFKGLPLKVQSHALTPAILITRKQVVSKTHMLWYVINASKTKSILLLVQEGVFFFLYKASELIASGYHETTVISLATEHIKLYFFLYS